ncbi:MAG: hypothetical protein EOP83_12415 [Verrucomicrobiaceae bacterium]|nr:MAG: hypothetical protein EOP83_12415 [Verrucomicrobiaceae bacterium]
MPDQSEKIAEYRAHRLAILSSAENNRWYKTEVRNGPVWDAFIEDFTWEARVNFPVKPEDNYANEIVEMIAWCEANIKELWYFRSDIVDRTTVVTVHFTNASEAMMFRMFCVWTKPTG